MKLFDSRVCALGEGPLWHPERAQLFWFDILGKRMLSRLGAKALEWRFDEHVSAAGWLSYDELLIASETALFRFDIGQETRKDVCELEANNPVTRSNDGRADPWGGFWIGTMGKAAEPYAGAIYRYYKGTLVQLYERITIPNSISFAPDGTCAYFTDTFGKLVMRQALGQEGWPKGEPEVLLDLRAERLNPDGSVVDAEGQLWNAQWGASRVACYAPDGTFVRALNFPAEQISCPAFGGDDLSTLFATSAATGLETTTTADGQTFSIAAGVTGQREHQVIL